MFTTNAIPNHNVPVYDDDNDNNTCNQNDNDNDITTTVTTTTATTAAVTYKWVCNGITNRSMPLNEAVMELLMDNDSSSSSCSRSRLNRANELIALGAVWILNDNNPDVTTAAVMDMKNHHHHYDDDHDSSNNAPSSSDEYKYEYEYYNNKRVNYRNNDSRYKRQMVPILVQRGIKIRCYPNAKRFNDACALITEDAKLYEDTTFIVVDKPPMLPTQPDASNYIECLPGCVSDNLGPFVNLEGEVIDRPLICHRVDSCVGGCVVLSKDRNGQRVFSALQVRQELVILYINI